MIKTADITRPPRHLIEGLKDLGAATIAGTLGHMGFRNPHMTGILPQTMGKSICGPALTLQCLPQRPDLFSEGEYADPETQLHRHVLYHVQEGDVVVVDARGDMRSGIFGDMMSTYFKGRGGAGIIIDGVMRDRPNVEKLDLSLWLKGWSPNYHVQTDIYPNAVNVTIACGGVTVVPGDIIVADDDGAVVVPVSMAEAVIEQGKSHAEWEEFSRMKLMEGASLQRYYPLHADAQEEYQAWRKLNPVKHG
ncbi:dimethylmenaquinone methyltransferase [Devosia sp. Root436]|uniref:ribonuclease activity regulator RraA n=1 Tax=Devosia sp. Root436 TaxID=1736537 RepID=UPI0006FD0989|nr:ribonuclease activity regulator RraA [Devosia sp. Root436]KQX35107.1 dimethylmenaquinone methyltransferase [Devosia sp. Root436]